MSIVTISRGSYSHGSLVGEKLAQRMGYACISRDVLLETSRQYNIPEFKLTRAIRSGPSFFERFSFGRKKYVAYIRATILKHLSKDNTVYHGFAGHFFVKDIPHALKVRINADMQERIRCMMIREGLSSEGKAERMVREVDEDRRHWSLKLYGIDTWDSRLYDLVISIGKITVEDAVETISNAIKLEAFKTTPESRKQIKSLASEACSALKAFSGMSPFFEPLRESPWSRERHSDDRRP